MDDKYIVYVISNRENGCIMYCVSDRDKAISRCEQINKILGRHVYTYTPVFVYKD
jgi:hypothetical protein